MPVSDEESGGVQGLRAWAADAAERVKRLTPAMGARDVPPQAYEPSIAELDQLAGLLDHDPALRSAVSVWLGGALAMRYSAGGGEPADRERAERLLREARDRGTALGAAAGDEHRRWAALFLVSVITPIRSQQGGYGAVPDLSALVDWFSQAGLAGTAAFNTELEELTAEVLELPLPPEFLAEARRIRGIFSTPPGAEFTDLLASMMPAGDPHTDQLRRMMNQMFGTAGGPAGGRTDASGPDAPGPDAPGPGAPEPRKSPDAEPSREPHSSAAPDPDPDPAPAPAPGPTLTPDDIHRLAAGLDAMNAATHGLDDVLSSGDPEAFNVILRRLGSVQKNPPPGPDPTAGLEAMRALLLNISPVAGGARQDQAAGRANLQKIVDHFATLEGSAPAGVTGQAVLGRAIALYTRVLDAGESEDVEALRDLVDEAEALEKSVPEDHRFRSMVLATLGAAYGRLGVVTRDRELMLRALPYMEKGISGVRDSGLPFADEMSLPHIPDIDLVRAGLTGERAPAREPVRLPPDASTEDLHRSAHSVAVYYSLTRDPAVLDRLIDELERVRDRVREGKAPRIAAEALWNLAMAYRERDVLNQDVQNIRALEAAQEALTVLAADVLLQSGAEHGLLAARSGASRGVQAALWAASQGRLHEAVAALELGRALVLHAASASSAVPELLDSGGHHDLAEAWRARDPGRSPATAEGVPDELPGTLRRQALEALGYRREGGLFGTPTLSELADAVAESGADALVYLVPCEDGDAGVAIAVSPALGAGLSVRPHLSGAESGPLERYLDATAARDAAARDHGDPSAEQTWEEALEALCDWAFQVLGPVLADVDKGLGADGRPLRIVLVPCGRLGLVPWHAARYPDDAPHRYLCETDVISYAASGSQFLRTVGRAPRDPASAPVLLADPSLDLTHAEVEVMALRDAFYQQARMVGGIFEIPEEELVPGTPDEVLAFLADGASLLHVASHGSAGTRPTVSALHLAAPGSTDGTSAEASGPEPPDPDPGMLTVTRLLDRPTPQRAAQDGPLVVLSACQTDLSTRDHDEALTLTTAFVSGGARDVVGSRWTTSDSASALLMAVFHHHLTVDGLSPVDALRAAQRWMLDPHRENPGSLGGELLRQMRRPDLHRISLWAAFIHQGHPGAGTNEGRKQEKEGGTDE
ncbi:CHAT domain-containing protein [Streptomyces sp. AS02]|uniref:CHAT domain-containing protein n=1 Tax=Streptomyces sp. AS02 TaxID=2938946 RepID=UPI002020E9E3|nr:CHAT domain-containing protein [Streptomyces sp. AS02]MCL8014256.1 CHAT domain-containing protein [Streptomyces sp. AS02]